MPDTGIDAAKRHLAGTVLVLNGPSSVGKTSVQREIQKSFEQPYLAVGIDYLFTCTMPARYRDGDPPDKREVFVGESLKDSSGMPVYALHFGHKGHRFMSGMHHAIAAFAACGNNVVVDHILFEERWLRELVAVLEGVTVYFIGLRAPLSTLESRERGRPEHPAGVSRWHYDEVHKHDLYDLELDTSVRSVQECTEAIRRHIQTQPSPNAFPRLRQLFRSGEVDRRVGEEPGDGFLPDGENLAGYTAP